MTIRISSPQTDADWQAYFQFRWQQLRAPWQQPPGSERDELEQQSYHRMVLDGNKLIAVGRLHQLGDGSAQIRYMAVDPKYQGQQLGARLVAELEQQAFALGCTEVVLNARDSAEGFYQRLGYSVQQPAPTQFGVAHYRMHRYLRLPGTEAVWQQRCQQLQQSWHQQIPLSSFMQLEIAAFDGTELRCQAPLEPNINLHGTMFAGSLYSLATLTGWGLLHLQLQALELQADLVLADASIRYLKPMQAQPEARCSLLSAKGDLTVLKHGRHASQRIRVELLSAGKVVALFEGQYKALLPRSAP
ncbi:bifunctional GNAT family N-acetyltransferase/hotdog fold thioesterase [Alkalimonas sp. MEB108]|uniref:Bifunctional GNAT family N-acetyltransferase/hotdog fold thioesterase n=1 Tax=Alkalimonas cellulosilytica TaxID=3058395 RepID=A0ABU7J615_9GAMM|nr:bifunctional GNAT family N-acetyltransferase/hotdog fold thioesterase [Alkalimonas sp. MEB108]MEE2001948.1 bifunctional GNAT family N-acetyltransferase/hotdog fold thioesterase [Alkalimonas sp. MEB108]